MKKTIAILTVFILVVGVAFALTETHTIKIKSVVDNIRPVIQLKLSYASSSGSTNNTANNGTGNRFDGTQSYTIDENNAIQVFSINKGGKVTFQALLMNQTNTTEAYSLSFSGGEFTDISRYGETGGTRAPSTITTAVGTTIGDSNKDKGIKSIALGTSTDQYNKPVVVTFEGQLDTTTFPITNGVVLATAEYDYPADPTIDSGTYYADVTLTVATV